MEIKGYYTVTQAAEILGVQPSRVRQYILAGLLPADQLHDRLKLISRRAVERFKRPAGKRGPKPRAK